MVIQKFIIACVNSFTKDLLTSRRMFGTGTPIAVIFSNNMSIIITSCINKGSMILAEKENVGMELCDSGKQRKVLTLIKASCYHKTNDFKI